MLLEFRVKNFRSFRDEAVLSFAASPDSTLESTHTRETGLEKIKRVLNTAAIYGANASGKTNVIRAFQFMQSMVTTSNQVQPDQENNLTPFRMRPDFETYPTLFETAFIIDGKRYQYGFELTRHHVISEWLLVYERAKPQVWFSRTYNEKKKSRYDYTYSDYFLGPKKVWETATRKEALFLTTAVQLNSEQLRPLYQRFSDDMAIFPEGGSIGFGFSAGYVQDPKNLQRVVSLIAAADTGISNVSFAKRSGRQLQFNVASGQQEVRDAELDIPQFGHLSEGQLYEFEISDESAGTQILFNLAGPILDILQRGRLLIVDELDRSLHPLLVQKILDMFNNPEINTKGAQLIFSTHDVSLLEGKKLRRDQIWFAEKDNEQVSHLFPLLDFSPRKGEALEKGYLGGRYGGIPILGTVGH
ncbi:AAA family ATPase [Rhizobium rhizogenes]|uniref:AAA family ATPase n=1 Tax=Rhizobium rhizogenes TaxID=359 RepID=UPI0015744BB5|nr:ATP-binding protein [Rhizobium rhizogenes]NTF65756.1 ATP-binding protein [Rhizobium rhizogenes]NTG97108.1 ATP-binding protein [Rhizobium rhizogenes]